MNTRSLIAFLFLLPTLIGLGVFTIYPAIHSVYLSFHSVAPFSSEIFYNGIENYTELFSSPEYWQSLKASFLFALFTVPPGLVISLIIAVLLDAQPYVKTVLRTIFLLPVGISTAMAAMLWVFLFNPTAGYLNYFLALIGVSGPSWLADPTWALPAVSIATIWKAIGFNVIFLLAALAGVPKELQEAALVDGAGPIRRFWNITLPMISPTLFFITIVSVIHTFEGFGQIHILTQGGPADATNVLVYNLYRDAFQNFRTGYASAQAIVLFVIILIATLIQFSVGRKRVHYG
jgi:sn-glycerol 3-phosphate transport system permease protein